MKRFKTKSTGILSSGELKTPYGKFLYWLFFAILLMVCAAAIIPALWTVLTAFKPTQEIYGDVTFFPREMSFDIFKTRIAESWQELDLVRPIINTLIVSAGSLFATLVIDGLGGYVLSKLKVKGIKFIFVLVVWSMLMPAQIRIVPNFIAWGHFPFAYPIGGWNLRDTYLPICLGAAANAFNVILFKNSFDTLSDSYVEAARLDECSEIGIIFRILFPLSQPIIIYVAIMTLNGPWSEFFTPMLYLSEENYTLPAVVYSLKSDTSIQLNTYFMCMVFSSIPLVVIFVFCQRYIMGGVNIGGVKG